MRLSPWAPQLPPAARPPAAGTTHMSDLPLAVRLRRAISTGAWRVASVSERTSWNAAYRGNTTSVSVHYTHPEWGAANATMPGMGLADLDAMLATLARLADLPAGTDRDTVLAAGARVWSCALIPEPRGGDPTESEILGYVRRKATDSLFETPRTADGFAALIAWRVVGCVLNVMASQAAHEAPHTDS